MTPQSSTWLRPPHHRFAVALVAALTLIALLHVPPTWAQRPPATDLPGSPRAGREVFEASCAMCHGTDAAGMMDMHPSLRGAVQRLSLEGVEVTVREGRATRPPMPAFEGRLTDEQIQDVISYIATLPPRPRNFGPRREQDDMMRGDRMMPGPMMGGWMMLLWALLVLALTALIITGLLWIFRSVRSRPSTGQGTSARRLLDERYARGELNRDEYLQRRRDLEG
ncbi:MAG: c-type cytochrome [Actinomycetota bacterium]|nr:c-type cytochrome [Actinomycetota bacterium]